MVEYKCEYTAITEQEDEYMIELIVSYMHPLLNRWLLNVYKDYFYSIARFIAFP